MRSLYSETSRIFRPLKNFLGKHYFLLDPTWKVLSNAKTYVVLRLETMGTWPYHFLSTAGTKSITIATKLAPWHLDRYNYKATRKIGLLQYVGTSFQRRYEAFNRGPDLKENPKKTLNGRRAKSHHVWHLLAKPKPSHCAGINWLVISTCDTTV